MEEDRKLASVFIGVDPGKSGSMAVLYTPGDLVASDGTVRRRTGMDLVLVPFGELAFLKELRMAASMTIRFIPT